MYQEHYFCPDDPSPHLAAGPELKPTILASFHVQNPREKIPEKTKLGCNGTIRMNFIRVNRPYITSPPHSSKSFTPKSFT
jgi:hypothetical protein